MWELSGTPHKVQTEANRRARGRPGFAYFMEMGLGKSATVLNEFKILLKEGKVDGMAIVCPNSIKQDWESQIKQWGLTQPILVWPKIEELIPQGDFILIFNYEAFSAGTCRGYIFIEKICKQKNIFLVLDESTQIKNYMSKRTRKLLALSPLAPYKRILSGAPVIQGPQDLWPQLRFIGAIPSMRYHAFRNRYCKMGGWMGKQIVGQSNEMELSNILEDWGFRARKDVWTDLPEKIYQTRYVEMTKEQKKIYKEMSENLLVYINGECIEANQIITQLIKLQQISSGFLIREDQKIIQITCCPPKVLAIEEIIDQITGKALIFTHFRYSLSLLENHFKASFNPAILCGGMSQEEIAHQKHRFSTDSACRAFIIQTQTGKYGHTLLGGQSYEDRCSTTIFYENSYSLDARLQAEDRNHRYGQDRAVVYVDLVSSKVEAQAILALKNKANVANLIVDKFRKAGKK